MSNHKDSELVIEDLPSEKKQLSRHWLAVATFGIILTLLMTSGMTVYVWQKKNVSSILSPLPDTDSTTQNPTPTARADPTIIQYQKREVIGFLPSWMVAKKAAIYPQRLSQLIYFAIGVNDNGDLIKFKEDDSSVLEWTYFNSPYFQQVSQQSRESGIKILVAIKNFDNESIDNLVSSQTATSNFIKQIIHLINEYNLDGVNIDFEYVTDTEFPTVKFFNRFLEILNTKIKENKPSLIVSVDINATAVLKDPAYDMVKIGELADQVILMAYDYHRAGSGRAGPVAPLYEQSNTASIEKSLSSLAGRVPSEKLILGLPFYGYEWQTVNANYKSPTVPNTGALATYRRTHDLIKSRDDVQVNWEEKTQSPWLVYRQSGAIKQIYYENAKSLSAKLDFVDKNNLAGIAIWALGYEGDYQEPWEVIGNTINK